MPSKDTKSIRTFRCLRLPSLALILVGTLISSYQNCSRSPFKSANPDLISENISGASSFIATTSTTISPTIESPTSTSYSARMDSFLAQRAKAWQTIYRRESFGTAADWDVEFDGSDSPADNVPEHLKWDSSTDDDWNTPFKFKLNYPEKGFLTVDRITEPGRYDKTGNIWIRDPSLTSADGITIEFRIKIPKAPHDQSMQKDAVSLIFQDDQGSFGVHLSPDHLKAGSPDPKSDCPWQIREYDFSREFQTIRLYKAPREMSFYYYIGLTGPFYGLVDGNPSYRAKWDGSYPSYPRILLGDNSNDLEINALFTLDYIRYRRGVLVPGRVSPLKPRPVPPLPPSQSETSKISWTGVTRENEFFHLFPAIAGPKPKFLDHAFEFDGRTAPMNARTSTDYTSSMPGLNNGGSFTIELEAKVLDGHGDHGFVLEHLDRIGGTTLSISKGKISLLHGTDNTGITDVPVQMTDRFHKIRLVRYCPSPNWASCLYVQVYLDDDPIPVIADRHLDGTVLVGSRLSVGQLGYPIVAPKGHL